LQRKCHADLPEDTLLFVPLKPRALLDRTVPDKAEKRFFIGFFEKIFEFLQILTSYLS
jgi:hypothetical protein